MTLTPEQIALLPSDDDVAFYREHGYYHAQKILTDEEIDNALAGSERFYRGELDPSPIAVAAHSLPSGNYGEKLRKHDYASFSNRELGAIARHPLIGAIAARLAETPQIRLWHDQLLYKPGNPQGTGDKVGWHTDRGYWKTCSSTNLITAWVPFHDCDADMGTIMMIDGSHRWPDNTMGLDFFSNDLDGLEKRFDTGGAPTIKVPMNLKKGEVSFHHCLVIHGSAANVTDRPRRSIAIHLQDEANRYQRYEFPNGSIATHDNDRVCRQVDGHPDYTDPIACPVLYPWPLRA